MRTILTTLAKDETIHKFSFETSPLLSQEEQIKTAVQKYGLHDFEILHWQYFDVNELKEPSPFPNGFDCWQETHFEISRAIAQQENVLGSKVQEHAESWGTGGLYDLAKELTDKFEKMHEGKAWGEDENSVYFDEIQKFLDAEL